MSSFGIFKKTKHLEAIKETFVIANVLKTYPKLK